MSDIPPCPECKSPYGYDDGALFVCPECGHEWSKDAAATGTGEGPVIRDANGNALPGFTLDDCVPVIGDRIDSVVRWKSDADLEDVAGEAVRVRFELKDADLFSMRFQ